MAKRGMIALNLEWFGMGQLRTPGFAHYKLNQLDLCGTSGLAPFYLAMKRGLDILLAHPNADPSRVGVAGLSGGGWQTIVISSLDTRVTLANPVAGYSSFLHADSQLLGPGRFGADAVDLAATADYAHLTAMLAPRVALLTYNEKDNCCFAAPHALPPLLGSGPARLSSCSAQPTPCTSTSTTIPARTTSSATTARRFTRSSASTGSAATPTFRPTRSSPQAK